MDYLTGMTNSPVYEFPYSGSYSSSLPFLNYNPNVFPSNITSPFDSLIQRQPLNFPTNNISQMTSPFGYNTVVYQVPGNIPLEVLLRELGVDVSSLHQTSFNDYYPNTPLFQDTQPAIDFIFAPSTKRRRRRRVMCREITDSETDDDRSHSSHHHHRQTHHQSGSYPNNRSPARLHHLLAHVWRKAANASENLPRPNSSPNLNSQRRPMPSSPPPMPSPPPPMPSPPPPMPRPSPPMSQQYPGPVGDVWGRAMNATMQQPNRFSTLLRQSRTGGGVNQPPPWPQQNQEAAQDYVAARDAVANVSQPNPAITNVWNRAFNAAQYGSSNQMPQPSPSSMSSMWDQMTRAGSSPQQPPPPMNPGWNPTYGGVSRPQSPPPMNPGWNPMYSGPPRPSVSASWNLMQQGSFQPRNSPYPPPPMGAPQQGPYPSAGVSPYSS